jgi:hypothetical protein
MRRSRGTNFLIEDDVFFGITLEADFTAEHEYGVKGITKAFGIPRDDRSKIGIERYIITEISTHLTLLKKGKRKVKEALLFFHTYDRIAEIMRLYKKNREEAKAEEYPNKDFFSWNELVSWQDPPQACSAWDENSFGVRAFSEEQVAQLEEVYEAFLSGDIAIWIGGGGPFNAGGMHLIIVSKMPNHIKQMLWSEHVEDNRIEDAVVKTGIREELKAAGKGYYALSPRFWKDEQGNEELKFFLNPHNQQKYDHGWFTVEELRQWTNEQGPVIKTEAKVS